MPAAKKPKKKNGKPGAPSKFAKISPRIPLLARRGFTEREIAETLDINVDTLTDWTTRHPGFFASLNDWKYEADKKVVRSLYERACGYSHPETKAQWVTDDILVKGEWRTVGRWEYAELTKHYPPETGAMCFWLKNRDRENWRDRYDYEHTDKASVKLLTELFAGWPELVQEINSRLNTQKGQKLIEGDKG